MPLCELCDAQQETYRIVAENEYAFAVVNIEPLKNEHVIIMPKTCRRSLAEFAPDEAQAFLALVEEMKKIIRRAAEQDVLVVQNSGVHASQSHVHFHVLPSKGNLRHLISHFEGVPSRDKKSVVELEELTRRLRRSLNDII